MKKLGALKEYAKKLGNYWAREDSNVKILGELVLLRDTLKI